MTLIIADLWFYMLLVVILLTIVFVSSILVTRWLKRKGMERNKKAENLVAFLITIAIFALYVALQEQVIYQAFKGDVIVTGDSYEVIEQESVRYLSTESPIRIYDLITYGYTTNVQEEMSAQVQVTTTDYTKLYENVNEHPDLVRANGTLDFGLYYETILRASVEEAFSTAMLDEDEPEAEEAKKAAKAQLEEQFPYHHFEFE